MADTTLIIGDIVLTGFEIPDRIPFGGQQMLNVHKLVGGQRVIDSMGPDDRPIKWSGLIFSTADQTADERATDIDFLRRQGAVAFLTFWSRSYQVVISSFTPDWERYYQIPYEIECIVLQDLSAPNNLNNPNADNLVDSDLTNALTLSQGGLEMDVPSFVPGPVSTYTGVTTDPSTDITWNGDGDEGGVDLTAAGPALTNIRNTVTSLPTISGLTPSRNADTVASLTTQVATLRGLQKLTENATAVPLKFGGVSQLAGVVLGQAGFVNAAKFTTYARNAISNSSLIDVSNSAYRMIDNIDITNGGRGQAPLDWNVL